MACKVFRDTHGSLWRVPAQPDVTTKGGKKYEGCPQIDIWWDRGTDKADENLIIRQENEDGEKADVLQLTLSQAYDLIHALGWAIKTP